MQPGLALLAYARCYAVASFATGLPRRSSERIPTLQPGFALLAYARCYAAAVFVVRCAPDEDWWSGGGLNSRPLECDSSALPN